MPKIFLSYHIEGHWPAAGSTDSEPPVPQQPQVPRAAASGPSQQRARGTVPTTSGTHESACKCITSEGHPTSTCLMRKIDNLYKEKLFPRAYLTWEDRKMSCTDYLIANNLKKFKYKIHSKLFFFFFYQSPKSVPHLPGGPPSTEMIFKCKPDLLLNMI